MPEENPQYLLVIANIIGVILGAGITALVSWLSVRKETKLRIQEKIFDRRITAHEEALRFSKLLRSTLSTKKADDTGELITYPVYIHNRKNFDELINELYMVNNLNSHWFDSDIIQELKYIQDYIGNLDNQLELNSENLYPKIGTIVRNDFFEISTSLEEKIIKFFRDDIYKIKLQPKVGEKKLEENAFQKRFRETNLYQKIISNQ